jgi:hypothetical protein
MFGFAKKTKSQAPTLLDGFINAIYGANPPKNTADVREATNLAANQLLGGVFERNDLARLAETLNADKMPYTTHDLAVSVALRAFKDVPIEDRRHLMTIQIMARLTVSNWAKEGKVVIPLAEAFEHVLYKEYKP